MKPKISLKVLGLISIVAGAGLTVLNQVLDDKKMDEKIETKVEEYLSNRNETEEES